MKLVDYQPQIIQLALIKALIRAVPPAKPREIRDREHGLILRHQPSGYLGLYAELGRGKRERICDARRIADDQSTWTIRKARTKARKLNVEHSDGRDVVIAIPDEHIAYSVTDAGRVIGVSRSTICRMIAAGEIAPIKLRARTLVPRTELERIISQRVAAARSETTEKKT